MRGGTRVSRGQSAVGRLIERPPGSSRKAGETQMHGNCRYYARKIVYDCGPKMPRFGIRRQDVVPSID